MIARLWSLCADAWTVFGTLACLASEGAAAIATFAAARARGCQQRMRRAVGLPPLQVRDTASRPTEENLR